MQPDTSALPLSTGRPYRVIDLNYVSLYITDFQAAIAFYSNFLGAPDSIDEQGMTYGWRLGATWLTIFAGQAGPAPGRNPCNTEFAMQVAEPTEVDALYMALLAAGAQPCMTPQDTSMYEAMRFACVDDPFGVRIDIYCPLAQR